MQTFLQLIDMDLATAALALVVVLLAGFIRGYSGFGFSAFVVTGLSMMMPPAQAVPMILLLEILASLRLWRQVWDKADWKLLGWLALGGMIASPFGVWLLAELPAEPMQAVVCALVLAMSLALWSGFALPGAGRWWFRLTAGLTSGLANGAAAVGGLFVVFFLLASTASAAAVRATVSMYILGADIIGFALAIWHDLVGEATFWRVGLMVLPMALGIHLGSRHFHAASPESFRRFAVILLAVLAAGGLVKAVL